MGINYIAWHYTSGLRKFFSIWRELLVFFLWRFAVIWHIKTLFSPWKRDISRIARRGFHPLLWAQNLIINGITRFLGAIVRSGVILFGILVFFVTLVSGAIFLAEWLLIPLFLVVSLVFGIYFFPVSPVGSGISFSILISSIAVLYLSLRLYFDEKKNYFSMNLEELAKQKWFQRVWERIGKVPSQSTLDFLGDPPLLKRFLESCGLAPEEFQKIVAFETSAQVEKDDKKRFWLKENLYSEMPIGISWAYAYTVNLDKYSVDFSRGDPTEYKNAELVSRNQDLEMLELVLSRPSQNNVLVVGEAGTGKHTLVHTFAKRVRESSTNPALLNKRVLELKLGDIISSKTNESQMENVLREMFFEAAYAGNVILIIDEIDRYLKSNPHNPKEDISAILVEFINYPSFQIIGITTPEKFHEDVEKNERITKSFEKIQIGEVKPEDTLTILLHKLKEVEKDGPLFTFSALKEIIKLSDRFFTEAPFPEKAVDLMEEVILYWSQSRRGGMIDPDVVDEVVSQKVKIPIGEVGEEEKDKLIHLEEILHQRLVGQDTAVRQIAETMRRARIGMASENKPMGSFLFLGPTGVGKTESAKAIAEAYFGDEKRMIRLDMSEYQKQDSIDRLIGSAQSGHPGILENKVKENPYALLLLDEIEKADPNLLNLFLQVLDEGWLTDAFGKKINFRNQIIIATSNAGSEIIKRLIEQKADPEKIQKEVTDHVIKEGIFKPEFLNRFEGVVFFHPLSRDDLVKVTQLMLEKYAKRVEKEKNIRLSFEPDVIQEIIEKSYDPVFGARAVNRYVEDRIGDNIVKKIISGEIKEGAEYNFGLKDLV